MKAMVAKVVVVITVKAMDWAKVLAKAEAFTAKLAFLCLEVWVNSVAQDLSALGDLAF